MITCKNCDLQSESSWIFCPQCGHRIAGAVMHDFDEQVANLRSSFGSEQFAQSALSLNKMSPNTRIATVNEILERLLRDGHGDPESLKTALEQLSHINQETGELAQRLAQQRQESTLQSDLERELRRTTRPIE